MNLLDILLKGVRSSIKDRCLIYRKPTAHRVTPRQILIQSIPPPKANLSTLLRVLYPMEETHMHSIPPPIGAVQILKNLLHLGLNIRLPTIRGTRQAKEAITRTQISAQIFNQCQRWGQMAPILRILRARVAPLPCKLDTIHKSRR